MSDVIRFPGTTARVETPAELARSIADNIKKLERAIGSASVAQFLTNEAATLRKDAR